MNSHYYQVLSERILSVLKLQPLKLCDIITESQGAYPDDVVVSISNLIKNKLIYINNDSYHLSYDHFSLERLKNKEKETLLDLTWIKEIVSKLSKPHPADYDWRFTNQTIFDLAQLVNGNKKIYTSVALFGTTTLFPIVKKISPEVNLSLFNKSESLIEDIKSIGFNDGLYVQDLFSKITHSTRYNLVIADPPWYNDFYNAFISRASEILEVGGDLYLSVLPILTRPEAEKDRTYIDQCCKENGFEKIESLEGFLKYESPIFERHSLINRGLECFDWRKGDLIIYRKIRVTEFIGSITIPNDEPLWEEYIINGVKLKLLKDNDDEDKFSFEYSDETNILSTVSRRSPIRKRINFWTSDNYAFKISKLKVLRYLFRFVNSHNSLELALLNTKIDEKLSEEEFSSLITLLKIANIYT